MKHARYVPPVADTTSDVDALILDRGPHIAICWTALVDGKRSVVALEVLPNSVDGVEGPREEDVQARASYLSAIPALQALTVGALRELSLGDVLKQRQPYVDTRQFDPDSLDPAMQALQDASSEVLRVLTDARLFGYLLDAFQYVDALEAGTSPRRRIQEWRGLKPQTADRRIATARELGFLTKAPIQRRAGGELTDVARDARTFLEAVTGDAENG